MFTVYPSNIWGPFYPASCARAASVCCSLPGKVPVALSEAGTKPRGIEMSRRKEQKQEGMNTFGKLFLHVRKQMMILRLLFTPLFSFKIFG